MSRATVPFTHLRTPVAATKRKVVRAFRPSKANNHPAVVLQVDRGFVHVVNGTSHPSTTDRRRCSNPVIVQQASRDAQAMGLSETTYFYPHMYHVLTDREFQEWNGGRFSAPLHVFHQLVAMVQDQMVSSAPRVVLPVTALTFQHDEEPQG